MTDLGTVQAQTECTRKAALLDDVRAAIAELVEILNQEVGALLMEDFDRSADLKRRLEAARQRKAGAIEIYREHVASHGC